MEYLEFEWHKTMKTGLEPFKCKEIYTYVIEFNGLIKLGYLYPTKLSHEVIYHTLKYLTKLNHEFIYHHLKINPT